MSVFSHNDWIANYPSDPYDDAPIVHGAASSVTSVAQAPCGMISPRHGVLSLTSCQSTDVVQRWDQLGSASDRGNISMFPSRPGMIVSLYRDVLRDATPGVYGPGAFALGPDDRLMAVDEDGDGIWDLVIPSLDTGADGIPDTGQLDPHGGYAHIIWELRSACDCEQALPPGDLLINMRGSSNWHWTTVYPTLPYSDDVVFHDQVSQNVEVLPHTEIEMEVSPETSLILPGQEHYYLLHLTSCGNVTDTFEISMSSSQGYGLTLYDANCLIPIGDLGGGPEPDVEMAPCQQISLCVGMALPIGAPPDSENTTIITATSELSNTVYAETHFGSRALSLVEGLIAPRDQSGYAYPAENVYYCQLWQNIGNQADRGNISLLPDQGWPVGVWRDVLGDNLPGEMCALGADDVLLAQDTDGDGVFEYVNPDWDTDADGIPDTGDLAADPDGPGPLQGGSAKLVIQVAIPEDAPRFTIDALVVQGFSHNDWTMRGGGISYNDPSLYHDQVTLYTEVLGDDFALSIEPWLPWACPGWNHTSTLVVTNTSESTLTDVAVRGLLPASTYLVPESTTPGYTESAGELTWTIPVFASGQTLLLHLTVRPSSGIAMGSLLQYEAEVSSIGSSSVITASAEVEIVDCPDVSPTSQPSATPTSQPTATPTSQPTATPTRNLSRGYLVLPLIQR
jgi:uncharacterized repeat protein (TIGR01451 family)